MTSNKVFFRTIFAIATLMATLISSSLLHAQEIENSINITGGLVGFFPDSDRNLDDEDGFFFGGELPVTERWSLTTDYYVVDTEVQQTRAGADLDFFRIGVNYHLNQIGGWQPYIGAGLGNVEVDTNVVGLPDVDENTFDVGIGMKRMINNNWMMRTEYRMINGEDLHGFDDAITFGIGYAFGGRSSTPATPARTGTQPSAVADSDNDGVPDNRDSCRNTPAGRQVDSRGCEIDSDRDGVVDSRDNCPDTAANLAVDNNGCPVLEVTQRRQELKVNFDTDRSEVKAQYDNEIEDFAAFMEVYGNTNVVIEGHTDDRGTNAYNQALSERRANAVRDELVNEHDVEASRVSTVGYGEERPTTTNNTAAGRAENRRIEAVISVDVEEQRRR